MSALTSKDRSAVCVHLDTKSIQKVYVKISMSVLTTRINAPITVCASILMEAILAHVRTDCSGIQSQELVKTLMNAIKIYAQTQIRYVLTVKGLLLANANLDLLRTSRVRVMTRTSVYLQVCLAAGLDPHVLTPMVDTRVSALPKNVGKDFNVSEMMISAKKMFYAATTHIVYVMGQPIRAHAILDITEMASSALRWHMHARQELSARDVPVVPLSLKLLGC